MKSHQVIAIQKLKPIIGALPMSLILYFSAIESTQQILRNQIIYEIDCISKKNQELVQMLISIPSAEGKENNIGKISEISNMLDALQKQKEQLEGIFPKRYNVKSLITKIITLSGSLLIPLITGLLRTIIEKNPEIVSRINYDINLTTLGILH